MKRVSSQDSVSSHSLASNPLKTPLGHDQKDHAHIPNPLSEPLGAFNTAHGKKFEMPKTAQEFLKLHADLETAKNTTSWSIGLSGWKDDLRKAQRTEDASALQAIIEKTGKVSILEGKAYPVGEGEDVQGDMEGFEADHEEEPIEELTDDEIAELQAPHPAKLAEIFRKEKAIELNSDIKTHGKDAGETEVSRLLNHQIDAFNQGFSNKVSKPAHVQNDSGSNLSVQDLMSLHKQLDKIISDSEPTWFQKKILYSKDELGLLEDQKTAAQTLQESIKLVLPMFGSNLESLHSMKPDEMLEYHALAGSIPTGATFETLEALSLKLEQSKSFWMFGNSKRLAINDMQAKLVERMQSERPAEYLKSIKEDSAKILAFNSAAPTKFKDAGYDDLKTAHTTLKDSVHLWSFPAYRKNVRAAQSSIIEAMKTSYPKDYLESIQNDSEAIVAALENQSMVAAAKDQKNSTLTAALKKTLQTKSDTWTIFPAARAKREAAEAALNTHFKTQTTGYTPV